MAALKSVLLVTNAPTPYRIPLFAQINRQLAGLGVHLTVAFATDGYSRRKWEVDLNEADFDHVILGSRHSTATSDSERTRFWYDGLLRLILRLQPDLVIVPGFSVASMKVWLLSHSRRIPYVIWSGSVTPKGGHRIRDSLRRAVARRSAGGVAYGSRARDYLIACGVREHRVKIGINTVDTEFFAKTAAVTRQSLPPTQTAVFTYVGYLTTRKNVLTMLRAMHALAQERADFRVEIIGDGDAAASLKEFVARNGLTDRVTFAGYQQQQTVAEALGRSTCFLYQTDFDIWGLVLVEAMSAGVPCIASVNAGATADLIHNGRTGFAVDFDDTSAVLEAARWVLDNRDEASAMGTRASAFVRQHVTIEASARGFVDVIELAWRDQR